METPATISMHRSRDLGIWVFGLSIALTLFAPPLISELVRAEAPPITIFPSSAPYNETHLVYEGEDCYCLRLEFPENCSDWRVEFESALFDQRFWDSSDDNMTKGYVHLYGINIDPDAVLGTYNFTIHFNYTDERGVPVRTALDYKMQYRRLIDIVELVLPPADGGTVTLGLDLKAPCEKVEVEFFSGGDIFFNPMTVSWLNLSEGRSWYSAVVHHMDHPVPIPQNGIGYDIRATSDGRNVHIRGEIAPLDWNQDEEDDGTSPYYIAAFLLVVIIVVILILIFVR
jgi:hypothetical protein